MAKRNMAVSRRKSEQVSAWVTPEEKAKLVRIFEDAGESASGYLYRLLRREIEAAG